MRTFYSCSFVDQAVRESVGAADVVDVAAAVVEWLARVLIPSH